MVIILSGIIASFLVLIIQLIWIPEQMTVAQQNLYISYSLLSIELLFSHHKNRLASNKIWKEISFVIAFTLSNGALLSVLNPASEMISVIEFFIKIISNNYVIVWGLGLILVLNFKRIYKIFFLKN